MAIFLGLGSNLGDRAETLHRALALLEEQGVTTEARSSLYETAPVGIPSQRPFLNAAASVCTAQSPTALLHTLRAVEAQLGRRRDHPEGDRTCDLDLLLYDDRVLAAEALTVPHPRLRERRFVLLPLLELDPALCDPITGARYADDAARVADDPAQRCVAVAGPDGWSRPAV